MVSRNVTGSDFGYKSTAHNPPALAVAVAVAVTPEPASPALLRLGYSGLLARGGPLDRQRGVLAEARVVPAPG